ncbi:hypothetical protein Mal48_20310 [Thalassoglobus polymorphus]|uniref:Zinc-finger domain-containing protein n=1 Tax=Thalassoglobus polymorphus TaxID=2527994 RepID=A0A517QMB8_9PLAN|nr:hypothetical protein Mal48_20310 [Thalassoglobus polymorphus]
MTDRSQNCPNQDDWILFLQAEDNKSSPEMARHLEDCPDCQQVVLGLEEELGPLQSLLRHGVRQEDFASERECQQAAQNLIKKTEHKM